MLVVKKLLSIIVAVCIALSFSLNMHTTSVLAGTMPNNPIGLLEEIQVVNASQERILPVLAKIIKGVISETATRTSATTVSVAVASSSGGASGTKVQVQLFLRNQTQPVIRTIEVPLIITLKLLHLHRELRE